MTPNALYQAKQRTRRRRHEAGAVMFVVSMMITVLAAVGLFALVASATEVRTAGNERQSAQTHFLAQYGILAVARETELGKGPALLSMALNNTVKCQSLPIPGASYISGGRESTNAKACARFGPDNLQQIGNWAVAPADAYGGATPYLASATNPGSLGPIPMTAAFYVEVTIQGPGRQPAGYSGQSWVTFEATSYGLTVPLLPGATNAWGAEGTEIQRARLNVGPMPGQ
jgi:hypothetical protein